MEIRQSAEDYLESILVLSKKGGGVRSIDIATRLGVSKPSVSHAMKLLREDGYIAMDRYGTVTLLEKGAEIANQIEIVVSLVPVQKVIDTAKEVLHTGQIGDGKVFVYDIENVVKIRTGEEGFLALQDTDA